MSRVARALRVVVAVSWTIACQSASQNLTAPTTQKCSVSATASPSSFPGTGGTGSLSVSANRDCQWNVAATTGWIQLASSAGQGSSRVSFNVAANGDAAARSGKITLADQELAITEDAACGFTVSPRTDSVSSAGGRKPIAVTASNPRCVWTAHTDVDWLAIVDGTQGTGSGQVTYEIRETSGPKRVGTLVVAGQTVTVTQAQRCTTQVSPEADAVPSAGGTGTISVSTDAGCGWSAASSASWIALTSAKTGSGPGSITFNVSAWDGPPRTGTITVDNHVVTISQATGCRYSIDPAFQSVAAAGGSSTVNVHAAAGCAWNATSGAGWLVLNAGASGVGDGHVQFTTAASTGPARSGTITVAGQPFTVNQASGCSYALVPAAQDFSNVGGTGTFVVNTSTACPWTATSLTPWVGISSGSAGTGTATVAFTVTPNPMGIGPKSGTISVNNQIFTVNEAAGVPCVYTLSSGSQSFSSSAASGSFSVSTVLTCPWSAVSNEPWITITGPPGGAGNGAVNFTIMENPPGSPSRTGSIDVRGQTFTIVQGAGGQDH
jgi:hypothetical protein